MTNLQDGAARISGGMLRRIWLLLPAAALSGLGVVVVLVGLVPLWASFQRDSQRLQELEQLRDQVSMMRNQLSATKEKEEQALAAKAKLVRLIAGSGDPSTFLAMMDREAKLAGVQLDLYEPQDAPAAAAVPGAPAPSVQPATRPPAPGGAPAAGAPGVPAAPADSLAVEGLSRRSLFVAARGSLPELLTFLRRIEALNLLVVQSDLNLSVSEEKTPDGKQAKANAPVVMKLALGLYSRSAEAGRPPAAAPGAPAPAAPAPAGAPAPAQAPPAPSN